MASGSGGGGGGNATGVMLVGSGIGDGSKDMSGLVQLNCTFDDKLFPNASRNLPPPHQHQHPLQPPHPHSQHHSSSRDVWSMDLLLLSEHPLPVPLTFAPPTSASNNAFSPLAMLPESVLQQTMLGLVVSRSGGGETVTLQVHFLYTK